MYYKFAKKAEGSFDIIAHVFEMVGEIEKEHGVKYRKLLNNLKNDEVFKKESKVI